MWGNFQYMKKIILVASIVFLLFPLSFGFSQLSDKPSTLGIILTSFSPYHFKDENGYTVIIGEVENTKNFPVTAVKILALFYDESSNQPLEAQIGTTIVDVIPPLGKVPYMIKSRNPDASITNVSVKLQGFNSAPPKNEELVIESEISEFGEQIKIAGSITNNASKEASQTKILLLFYDAFQPPRIIWISTIELEEAIESDFSVDFEFNEKFDPRSLGYKIFAESDNSYSNIHNVEIIRPDVLTKLVTISDVSINDDEGNKLLDISKDSTINIQSQIWLQYATDQETLEQPYVYYVQIKKSVEMDGKKLTFVEFVGTYEGTFQTASAQIPTIPWTTSEPGFYYIETFVWDPNAVPLASLGPIMPFVVI